MAEVITELANNSFDSLFVPIVGNSPIILSFLKVFVLGFFLILLSAFIWYFYKSLSERDIIELKLKEYYYSNHPVFRKTVAVLFYLVEYAILAPLVILLWYGALSLFLLVCSDGRSLNEILLLTAGFVFAVRFFAYAKTDIAKDLSSLFPYYALSVFILTAGSLDLGAYIEHLKTIPQMIYFIGYFVLVLFVFEFIMRMGYTFVRLNEIV